MRRWGWVPEAFATRGGRVWQQRRRRREAPPDQLSSHSCPYRGEGGPGMAASGVGRWGWVRAHPDPTAATGAPISRRPDPPVVAARALPAAPVGPQAPLFILVFF